MKAPAAGSGRRATEEAGMRSACGMDVEAVGRRGITSAPGMAACVTRFLLSL